MSWWRTPKPTDHANPGLVQRLLELELRAGKINLAPIVTWRDLEQRTKELELLQAAWRPGASTIPKAPAPRV